MLNKKTQYALQALMYLAEHQEEGPVLISAISKDKKIPLKFLESILLQLKNDGLLESKKGKGGGYLLKVSPKEISVARIIRLIHGPIAMLPCVSLYFYERCENCNEEQCGLHDTMILARDATLKVLEKKSIADISQQPKAKK